jgi:prepilin-type processing-associated H-X9-DG protein
MISIGDDFCRSRDPRHDASINFEPIIAPYGKWVTSKTQNKQQPGFLAHRGRCNRAFVDGHIESEDMRKTFEARDDQLARWNIDNLPHRERLRDY